MEEQQAVCPSCGHFNRASARFCGKCGYDMHKAVQPAAASGPATPVAAAQSPDRSQPVSSSAASTASAKEFCPACGKEVTPGARFCRSCGQDLAGAPVQPVSASPDPAPATPPVAGVVVPVGAPNSPVQASAVAVDAQTGAGDARRKIPGWLWLAIGVLVGIVLGAGFVLALPGIAGLERTQSTPIVTETPSAEATLVPTDTTSQPTPAPDMVEPAQESAEPAPTDAPVEPGALEPDPNEVALPTPTVPSIESPQAVVPAEQRPVQPEDSPQPATADTTLAPEQDANPTAAP